MPTLVNVREEEAKACIETLTMDISKNNKREAEKDYASLKVKQEMIAEDVWHSWGIRVTSPDQDMIDSLITFATNQDAAIMAFQDDQVIFAIRFEEPVAARSISVYFPGQSRLFKVSSLKSYAKYLNSQGLDVIGYGNFRVNDTKVPDLKDYFYNRVKQMAKLERFDIEIMPPQKKRKYEKK